MFFYIFYILGMSTLAFAGTCFGNKIVFVSYKKNKRIELIWLLMIIVSIIILGLRNVVTGDFDAYSRGFDLIYSGDTSTVYYTHNVLYIAIVKFAIAIGGNIHTVFFLCASISIVFLALGLNKINCNKYLFLSLYLLTFQFFDQFNIIRQGTAMSICFFAVNSYLIKSKSFIKYIFFVAIAALFHLSAIVMVPIYFIVTKKIPFSLMLISIIGIYFLSGALANIPAINDVFGKIWADAYTKEFDYALITISEVIIAVFILACKKKLIVSEEDNIVLNLVFFFPLFRMGASHFFILHRLSKYFINYYIIGLLMLPRLFEKQSRAIVYFLIFTFYFLWFYFYMSGYKSFHDYEMVGFFSLFGN